MQAYTDYPISKLGDTPYEKAPIRRCNILSYDGSLYCKVEVGGVVEEIKSGYLYTAFGRYGDVPNISYKELDKLRK